MDHPSLWAASIIEASTCGFADDGCIDVDISAAPFTNTLPIRRLGLMKGERREIRVAYLALPALTVEPADQAYTCIEPQRRYLYEKLFRQFQAELGRSRRDLTPLLQL